MKRKIWFIALLAGICIGAAAAPEFGNPKCWKENSSGRMTITRGAEGAVCFDVKFRPGTDFWAYPEFSLPEGIPADANYLVFEVKMVQAEPEAGYRHAFVMFGYKGGVVAWTPAPWWQLQVIDLSLHKIDRPAAKALRIGANPNSPALRFLVRNIRFLEEMPENDAMQAAGLIGSKAPAMLFVNGAVPELRVREHFPGLSYEVFNHRGFRMARGDVAPDGRIRLPCLPCGYYRIALDAPGKRIQGTGSFAVIPDPAKRRTSPDSPFCMDAALNVVETVRTAGGPGGREEGVRRFVGLAGLAGLNFVRERIHQDRAEPRPGVYDWEFYGLAPRLLAGAGIGCTAVWHDLAPWARVPGRKYGRDLAAVYRFAKKLAETFRGQVSAWEFWNEPDTGYWDGTTWEFAAAAKAAFLGFKAGDPGIPVVNGGFAVNSLAVNAFPDDILRNDLAEYFDIFNIHIYDQLRDYPAIVADWRRLLAQHGAADMRLWVTENGTYAEGSAAEALPGSSNRVQSPEQEMVWAEFVPKSQILLRSLGAARTFTFVLPPMNEKHGRKEWGMIRRDGSARPAFAAFATLTDQLAAAQFLGEPDLGSGIRAFLFRQPDGSQTLAFWSESELDRTAPDPVGGIRPVHEFRRTFAIPASRSAVLTDLFGMSETVSPEDGRLSLTATRFPAYLSGGSDIPVRTPPVGTGAVGARMSGLDKSVVLSVVPSEEFTIGVRKNLLLLSAGAKERKVKLRVANFSEENKRGVVAVEGAVPSGLPGAIELAPFEEKEFELRLPAGLPAGRHELVFGGLFNGRRISRLVLPVVVSAPVAETPLLPGSGDPVRWRKNSSGAMTIAWDEREKAVRFDVEFPPDTDRWVYPEFMLPDGFPEGTLGFSFEIRTAQAAAEKPDINLVMLVEGEGEAGKSHHVYYTPSCGEWRENFIELASFSPGKIRQFRIGMNPCRGKVTFFLRNIRLHLAGKGGACNKK